MHGNGGHGDDGGGSHLAGLGVRGASGEKEREMVGDRNVLVDSGFMEIKWIITRPKVLKNSGTVGNSLGGSL